MLKIKYILFSTTFLIILSGQSVRSYESVHNKSLGKMEMLEAIDNHIKNSISKDIEFLKSEFKKLKKREKPSSLKKHSSGFPKELPDLINSNSAEIRRLRGDLDRAISNINRLSKNLEKISKEIKKTIEDLKKSDGI
jgi:hypothetical protein